MPVDVVLPVAGLATRLLPLTKAVPKALLPLGGRTVLDHILDELRDAGATRVVIVVSPGDDAIRRHLDPDPQLAKRVVARDANLAAWLENPARGLVIEFVTQPEPLGLGDALTHAAPVITGEFAVALGDALVTGGVLTRLAGVHTDAGGALTIAVEEVPADRVSSYGIVDRRDDGSVAAIVEKPSPTETPSRLAVAARYIASPALFAALEQTGRGTDGEISVTDAIQRMIANGERVMAVPLEPGENRRDVGTVAAYARVVAGE